MIKVKTLKRYEELRTKVKDLTRSKTNNSDDYDEKYMNMNFISDDDLPLQKRLELCNMTIVVRAVFHKDNKY